MISFETEERILYYVGSKIRNFIWLLRSIELSFKNSRYNLDIGGKYQEIDNKTEWIVTGFTTTYYPQVGVDLQNSKDTEWFDCCSVKRFERDFIKIQP